MSLPKSPQAAAPKPVSGRRILLFLAILTLLMVAAAFFIARAMMPEVKQFHKERPNLPPPTVWNQGRNEKGRAAV